MDPAVTNTPPTPAFLQNLDRALFAEAAFLESIHREFGWTTPERAAEEEAGDRRRKRARAPASGEAILGLQEVSARDAAQECAVCLQDFGAEETLRAMPCSHAFHQDCIFAWLRRNGVCPLCRRELTSTDQEQQQAAAAAEEEEEEEEGEWLNGLTTEAA